MTPTAGMSFYFVYTMNTIMNATEYTLKHLIYLKYSVPH